MIHHGTYDFLQTVEDVAVLLLRPAKVLDSRVIVSKGKNIYICLHFQVVVET